MIARFRWSSRLLFVGLSSLALATMSTVTVADTIAGFINDNTSFQQTSNSAPAAPFGFFFAMGAFFSTAGDFTSGSATYPGPGSQALTLLDPTTLQYQTGYFPTLAALHAAYPFGTYTITATGPAGTQTSRIPYDADFFTSNVPYVTDYSSLSGFDPAMNFTATYPSFVPNPNTNQAFTFFTIYNSSTGAIIFTNGFQSPSSTSTIIPAGTLAPNTTYDFELDYDNRLNGADLADGTFTSQFFDVRTDGSFTSGAVPPAIAEPGTLALLASGLFGLAFHRRRKRAP